jgi:hypothetical protein
MFQNDFKKQVQIFQKKLNTTQVKQVNNGRIPMDIDTINSFPNIIPFPNINSFPNIIPVPMEIDEPITKPVITQRVNMEID